MEFRTLQLCAHYQYLLTGSKLHADVLEYTFFFLFFILVMNGDCYCLMFMHNVNVGNKKNPKAHF